MNSNKPRLSTRTITFAGLLIALNVVLNLFVLPIGNIIEITIAFLPILYAGYYFGPWIAGVIAVIGDVLGFIIRPAGFFFIGFTFNAWVSGMIYGYILHNKPVTWKRVAVAVIVQNLIVSVILTPIWLQIMYGTALLSVPRLIRVVIMVPIEIALAYFMLNRFDYRMEK
ncbi:folate family ECF transporter S component [Fundicoccus culcitae]|uniref:Folate family ECF transporter S component n=1 Tax=Fundicoccus culcitae TaxID=2969821 RepID=A0ABY5P4B1_9LACT|nr:folate family ECF transporter S component [Fundicoccus culcitae]UUX33572.1 folate family ECF transporter S component [Fundicoccus culcitae]